MIGETEALTPESLGDRQLLTITLDGK